uniref:Uncharacterized protein n=1 Tax=Anguilla anguilla TaxID=7936 RepID=A0A0E9U1R1_ANGAN
MLCEDMILLGASITHTDYTCYCIIHGNMCFICYKYCNIVLNKIPFMVSISG